MLPLAIRSELAGKRIFMTGATGLFGRWLLSELAAVDLKLVLLTRDPEAFTESFPAIRKMQVSFVSGDVRSFNFPKGYFDFIVHAATPVASNYENENDLISVIVEGTRRVLEFARFCKAERFLYVSSGAVYGTQPAELGCIPETFPCVPVTAYGKGKLAAENLCKKSGINCVIARCFSFIGPGIDKCKHFAIGNFIKNCLRNEPIEIKGDGTPLRSYMYATDLVEWLMQILIEGNRSEMYNVGSEESISIRALAQFICKLKGCRCNSKVSNLGVFAQHPPRYIPSTQKAVSELGLTLRYDLKASIHRCIP